MLFSDIEKSTLLLAGLGDRYTEALDLHRSLLRSAWARWSGREMGTEGDGFFVVFDTAEQAVSAAAQAQRDLSAREWPEGVSLRVRIGVHTGSPKAHDGGYVGMDVHRAARIAAAAHGGQVVLSAATAALIQGHFRGVSVIDLGEHTLKDLPSTERLFQLVGDSLDDRFPPLRSLGSGTSLPMAPTPLIGREDELAQLSGLLRSDGVRLVTMTGVGGSGKTRLVIELAHRMADQYSDGAYFIPLGAVKTSEVMWTTMAGALDAPSDDRTADGVLRHVKHRSALVLLDNLEQLVGADSVVAQLLETAPRIVVVATSRRPLHLPPEHEYVIPPLELPARLDLESVEQAAAVQLFVQQARLVRADFALSAPNASDVAAICRRLDGLPLAVELAAARIKMLSPRALLSRLDNALDMAATSAHIPQRQRTLRTTIGWSYDLLTADQQGFFRRLSVFADGADLDAVSAVVSLESGPKGRDVLDVTMDLVDASLLTVTEMADGEPRVGMLETVRAFALDQLNGSDELDVVRRRHGYHFLRLAEEMSPQIGGPGYLDTRAWFETELENLRAALSWAADTEAESSDPASGAISLRLCSALFGFWNSGAYFSEARRWLKLATDRAAGADSPEQARCLSQLSHLVQKLGDLDTAHEYALESVRMWRRVGPGHGMLIALANLGFTEWSRGRPSEARALFEEAISASHAAEEGQMVLPRLLNYLGSLEAAEHDYRRAQQINEEAIAVATRQGDLSALLDLRFNGACTLRQMGQAAEAVTQMRVLIPQLLIVNEPKGLITTAEDFAAALADTGDRHSAARLVGAAEAARERLGIPRDPVQQDEIAPSLDRASAALGASWDDAYDAGHKEQVEDVLTAVGQANHPDT